ncbi:MAG: class I SAM-dependent methyltransferase [Anaerolineae bacterium]|nr:class I SAM-dependent methyltransferase [Anaerolineae bacterium]
MSAPTDFYDALAPLFDVMTDWDARLATEGRFLCAVLEEAGAHFVLDAACGSGGHALWLARQGYRVAGADISPAMIDLARRKAAEAGLDLSFVVTDLANLQSTIRNGQSFDAVLCLGNSLPHLLTQGELIAALRGMASVLRPAGLLVLQNLNYDLRWQRQPRWFAAQGGVLDGQEVLVWRFADYDMPAGRIAFHIALFRKDASGWQVEVHTTPQRPLFQADLAAALAEAGFTTVSWYGGMVWPGESFEPERSPDLVAVAQKRCE